MRDFEMEEIAEVQMPPLSKRPRLDLVENGDLSIEPYDQTTFTENGGRHAEADFHSSSEISGDFDSTKNGVSKSKMAEAVSAGHSNTQPSENQFADASPKDQDANVPDEETGNDSDISDISNLSGESEMAWRPIAAGPMAWVQDQMLAGKDPRVILRRLVPDPDIIPYHLEDLILWKIVASIVTEPPRRKKLKHINTIEDVVAQLKQAKKIMVLTGAGVSVSCGIPDFRSRDGIYARLAVDFPDLPDPQAMFDINYFKHDPRPFFKFAKEIYPGQFEPSHCHKFISLLEKQGKLLRNYTQNIDTLEQVAGISKIIQCHGSFASATCMNCHYKVDAEAIRKDIFDQVIPHCPRCSPSCQEAVMKPDIVFFGESLPEEFHSQMAADKDVCDLLIVVGSSLKVRPVALIPNSLPAEVPQILINREPLHHLNFDVELLGDCDVILGEICHRLGDGWSELFSHYDPLQQVTKEDIPTPDISQEDKKPCFSQQETPQTLQQTTSDSDRVSPSENSSCVISEKNYVATDSVRQTVDAKGDNSDITDVKGDNFEGAERFPDVNTADGETSNKPSLEDVRDWWQSRHNSISSRLAGDQFMFIPPHRYVFSGAEVYSDSESENGQFEDADESSSVDDTEGDGHQNTDVDNLNSDMLENGLESCQTLSSGMESETCCEQRAVQSDPLLTESLDQNKLSAAKDCFIPHPDPTSEIKNFGRVVDTEISEMADKAPSQNNMSVERTGCLATPTIADSCV